MFSIKTENQCTILTGCVSAKTPTGKASLDLTISENSDGTSACTMRIAIKGQEAISLSSTNRTDRAEGIVKMQFGPLYDGINDISLRSRSTLDRQAAVVEGVMNGKSIAPFAVISNDRCSCNDEDIEPTDLPIYHAFANSDLENIQLKVDSAVSPALKVLIDTFDTEFEKFVAANFADLHLLAGWERIACKTACTVASAICLSLCPETGPGLPICAALCAAYFNTCWDICNGPAYA